MYSCCSDNKKEGVILIDILACCVVDSFFLFLLSLLCGLFLLLHYTMSGVAKEI